MSLQIFDAHLDLALNAIEFRRDLALSLDALRDKQTAEGIEKIGTPTVTFEELRRGGVTCVLSTLLARSKPWAPSSPALGSVIRDWPTQDMVYGVAMGQLAWYRLMEQRGLLRIVTSAAQLAEASAVPGVVLTLEGADPVTDPDQLPHWHDAGLRTLMLAHFGVSHYAHGTPSDDASNTHDGDGPLSDRGRALLSAMHALAMPLDLTHLSDTSFFEAVAAFPGRIYSSHSGCRAICDRQRNHTDDMLRIIVERGGVVGMPMFNWFLHHGYERPPNARRELVPLRVVVDHIDHVCQLAGSADHVGIGSDLDGGFGLEHIPNGMNSIADLSMLAGALRDRGYCEEDLTKILAGNWLRFFGETLP